MTIKANAAVSLRKGFFADVFRVLTAAEAAGFAPKAVEHWYSQRRIAEFGNLTAEQLVEQGKAQAVVDYIESRSAGATG